MNQKHKFLGFCFAVLLAIFNITGVLAKEKPLFFPSEEGITSNEILQAPGTNALLASEEVLARISLPEYSEDQFSKSKLLFPQGITPSEEISQPEKSIFILKRDLRAIIEIQLFPFHFFL